MYGGLETIRSYRSPARALKQSLFTNRTTAPFDRAFSPAMASAASLTSTAVTRLPGASRAMETASAPEPVPMSSTRMPGFIRRSASSQRISVSGRGQSTPGVTRKVSPMKPASPRMYCIGSRASRRASIASYAASFSPSTSR